MEVLTADTGQLLLDQLAGTQGDGSASCLSSQLTLPHQATNPLLGMCIFYILFLLLLSFQFSITIELFSKPSFTLPDSHVENAIDLLICPRKKLPWHHGKNVLSFQNKRLFQHLCHSSRRHNPLHKKRRVIPTLHTQK